MYACIIAMYVCMHVDHVIMLCHHVIMYFVTLFHVAQLVKCLKLMKICLPKH